MENGTSIKVQIDTKSNKVVYAEASKDFVDLLLFLLSLPIGIATKLVTRAGSIGNIYTSVSNLDQTYLRRTNNVEETVEINPMVLFSLHDIPLSFSSGLAVSASRKFYTCWKTNCKKGITDVRGCVNCPGCGGKMSQEIEFIGKDSKGYGQDTDLYMISDDLSVTSLPKKSIMSMMKKFFNVSRLEERNVKIGNKEVLELLKASLKSTTVLTDVLMTKKECPFTQFDPASKVKQTFVKCPMGKSP